MGVADFIDSCVSFVNPGSGLKRKQAREVLKRYGNGYVASQSSEIFRNMKASGGSADSVLEVSLDTLRKRSRHAYRNFPSAKSGIEARVGIVVSTGIDVEPNTGDEKQDAMIREAWVAFCKEIDAAGQLSCNELQRQAFRCEGLNGAYLFQIVMLNDPTRLIPLALHAIESDQLSPEPVHKIGKNNRFSNGVETNKYGRPIWYHITDHPSADSIYSIRRSNNGQRIPAEDIIHGYEKLRPGQSTGEPILCASLKRLTQEEDLVEYELESAKMGSAFGAAIYSDISNPGGFGAVESDTDDKQDELGNDITQITAGAVARLSPGEKLEIVQNTRPSQAIAPFRDAMRGDTAATLQISRSDMDKDYSQANYSSMRAAQLDKKRALTPHQNRFGETLVSRIYLRALPLLAIKFGFSLGKVGSVERMRQERHKLVPDGWAYVDPEKEVKAALAAIEGGLSTFQKEIGKGGEDAREVHRQLEKEMDMPLIAHLADTYRRKHPKQEGVEDAEA